MRYWPSLGKEILKTHYQDSDNLAQYNYRGIAVNNEIRHQSCIDRKLPDGYQENQYCWIRLFSASSGLYVLPITSSDFLYDVHGMARKLKCTKDILSTFRSHLHRFDSIMPHFNIILWPMHKKEPKSNLKLKYVICSLHITYCAVFKIQSEIYGNPNCNLIINFESPCHKFEQLIWQKMRSTKWIWPMAIFFLQGGISLCTHISVMIFQLQTCLVVCVLY